ncbi:MAG: hypothetical protein JRI43_04940 [Deltaproteobacteria bacterium]|nr:hypothetical protein [Deltaproteobacteria bacterium]MBW1912506.1 hypothetical protein [Deltaproteobacteria bacterium]
MEKENRREYRSKYGYPELVYAELSLGKNIKKDKVYYLKVMDCSKYGLSLIITQKDLDMFQMINEGDLLQDISFFAERAMIKIDGTVRHKSRIDEGKYQGCYVLGIESPDIIESCRPVNH